MSEHTPRVRLLTTRRNGKNQEIVNMILEQANDRGIQVEVTYPEAVSAVSDPLRPLVVAWVSAQQRHLHNSTRGIATLEQRRAWEREAETMIATARAKWQAEAWEQGRAAEERAWTHVFDGHPVPEGDLCEECLAGNPYTEGAEK